MTRRMKFLLLSFAVSLAIWMTLLSLVMQIWKIISP